jgi:hypothetical protein
MANDMEANDMSNEDMASIKQEQEQFLYHLSELENIDCVYNIEDMGESPEREYLMYIADHCREIRELIDKLYQAKIYIIKNDLSNKTEFYRDKIVYK